MIVLKKFFKISAIKNDKNLLKCFFSALRYSWKLRDFEIHSNIYTLKKLINDKIYDGIMNYNRYKIHYYLIVQLKKKLEKIFSKFFKFECIKQIFEIFETTWLINIFYNIQKSVIRWIIISYKIRRLQLAYVFSIK